jgi:hypothetical protein
VGEAELELNPDNERVRDDEKHIKNPDAPRVQVESALALTLTGGEHAGVLAPSLFLAPVGSRDVHSRRGRSCPFRCLRDCGDCSRCFTAIEICHDSSSASNLRR